MNKKTLAICLVVIGAVLLIASLTIPLIQMNSVHTSSGMGIIGGASMPTYRFYYCGIYPVMTFIGTGVLVAASVVALLMKKKN